MKMPSLSDLVRGEVHVAAPAFDPRSVTWRSEAPAALAMFVVAVPLCLGIALASGVPLFAGIIAGIVGGVVVGALSGTPLMVSGPAAGLTAIVVTGLESVGSFEALLLAVVLAGVLQLGLALGRAGIVGTFFPSAVVRGMIAAIGIILVLKQIPHAVGYDTDAMGDESFLQPNAENTLSGLVGALTHIEWGAVVVALVALAVLWLWPRQRSSWRNVLPPAVAAVLSGVAVNALLLEYAPTLGLTATHLVSLPVTDDWTARLREFHVPDFSAIASPATWRLAVIIAIVASLESLLSVEATERLDPYKRVPDVNRELFAQGAGNIASGLLGGLPVTGVMIRTAAGIDAGARTNRATILHGALLAVTAFFAARWLNLIPLAAVAAVLIALGFRLASPAVAREEFRYGRAHAVPFAVTVLAILVTDLLIGLVVGLAVGIFYVLEAQHRSPPFSEVSPKGAVLRRLLLQRHVTYLHRPALVTEFQALEHGSRIELDGRQTERIDADVLTFIHDFHESAVTRGIDLRLVGIPPRP